MVFTATGMRRALIVIGAVLAAPLAFAHAHLEAQTPAANAQVTSAPQALTLKFSEGIEPKFSGLTITNARKQTIKTGTATRSEENKSQLVVPLEDTLQAGEYTVDWHVVSVDGHKTKGSYTFSVK